MSCSTPSGNSPWDILTPSASYVVSSSSTNASFYQRWSTLTVVQNASQFSSALVDIPTATLMAGGASNGFVPGVTFFNQPSGVTYMTAGLTDATQGSWAQQFGCPAFVSGQANHFSNTAVSV
jgi:hypothetical protein